MPLVFGNRLFRDLSGQSKEHIQEQFDEGDDLINVILFSFCFVDRPITLILPH